MENEENDILCETEKINIDNEYHDDRHEYIINYCPRCDKDTKQYTSSGKHNGDIWSASTCTICGF